MIARFMDGPLMGKEMALPTVKRDEVVKEIEIPVATTSKAMFDCKSYPTLEEAAANPQPSLYKKVRYTLVHSEADEAWFACESMERLNGIFVGAKEGKA